MSFGAPVVTAQTSSLPEVAGDAAILVDPEDVDEIFDAMGRVLFNPALAEELSGRARKRASLFSWRRSAELTWQAYQSV